MRNGKLELLALLLLALSVTSVQAIEFELIGPGAGFQDVSANGATVLLFDYQSGNAYLWTAEDGLVVIGNTDANSPIYEISWDGTTVVGTMELDAVSQASIWTEEGGWQNLGGFPVDGCSIDNQLSSGWGISADGSVAVGLGWLDIDGSCRARAMRWSEATGMEPLHVTNTHRQSRASGISADGRIAVGWTETDFGTWRPSYWDADGIEHLIAADPEWFSEAHAANADGSVIVGHLEQTAFRWTLEDGPVDLGLVPGVPGPKSRAVGVSADGNTIVGWGGNPPFNLIGFMWTPETGMVNLHDLVTDAGIDLGNQILTHATAVNADGNVIVGALYNPANFTYQAFRLVLDPPEIPPIPNGQDPSEGQPLMLEKLPTGALRLSWSSSCLQTETDYGVYEGTLGDFSSHTRKLCGMGGSPDATVLSSPGNTYYLVVPFNDGYEASYGADSESVERPVGDATCAAEQTSGSCEW